MEVTVCLLTSVHAQQAGRDHPVTQVSVFLLFTLALVCVLAAPC